MVFEVVIHDPNSSPGPLLECEECGMMMEYEVKYCKRCGMDLGWWRYYPAEPKAGQKCIKHIEREAVITCAYCGKLLCNECIYKEGRFCDGCRRDKEEKSSSFWENNRSAKYCWRHPSVPAEYVCKVCGLVLCGACAYFPVKGILRPRVVEEELSKGPYCLHHFRLNYPKQRWVVAFQLKERKVNAN